MSVRKLFANFAEELNYIMQRIIAPSLLSADFGHLDRDVRMLDHSSAEWIHIDVMDGRFVPNISFGFPVMAAVKRATRKPLDVHLMIAEPERYVERFAREGGEWICFHIEATEQAERCIELIHNAGARAGVAIKPGTPVEAVADLLPKIDMVLVMSVEPGFGGQKFMPEVMEKVHLLRERIDREGLNVVIEIDGGISAANVGQVFAAGVDVAVAGSAVFRAEDPEAEIDRMLRA